MNRIIFKFFMIAMFLTLGINISFSQTVIMDTLMTGTLQSQVNTLEYRTRTYDNFRAIREDYFQLFTRNSIDSLNSEKENSRGLRLSAMQLNSRIDSLSQALLTTKAELEDATKTKDSVGLLGAELNKKVYNSIVWTIIIGLVVVLLSGLVVYKRCNSISNETKRDHQKLVTEFEEYKTKTRLEREKMNVDHFREIQKLKGINKQS